MKYTLSSQDYNRIGRNALIFSAPAILLILVGLQAGQSPKELLNVVYLWGINTLIDLTRKFIAENK